MYLTTVVVVNDSYGMTFGEQVGALRRSLHRLVQRQLAGRSELSFNQLLSLRVISRQEVETQAELADRLVMDAAAVSRLVTALERDGLLRRPQGKDRRSVKLEVTAKGRKAFRPLDLVLEQLDAEVREYLTRQEFEVMTRLMGKVEERLTEKVCGKRKRAS